MDTGERDTALEAGLLAIRVSCAALFLVWSIDKIVHPDHAQGVFKVFYFMQITEQIAIAVGVVQTVIVLGFLIGAMKTWTYGAVLLMHTISVVSTWERLLTPYAGNRQILFWGAVPVVAALLLLFLVRKRDRLLSV